MTQLKRGSGRCRRVHGQHLRHLGVLLPRHLIGRLQLETVGAAQQKLVELVVQRVQQPGKVQAAAGEVQGEILRAGAAPLQQVGAGVVEGVVGVGVVGLPAILPQQAPGAHLLGGPVKEHGGIFRTGRRGVGEEAVVHGAERGGGCRRLLTGGGAPGDAGGALGQPRQQMLRQQQVQSRTGNALAQQRQQVGAVQQQVHGGGHGAECQRRQKPSPPLQGGGSGRSAAEHGGQQHRITGVEIQHETGHGTGSRRGGRRQAARRSQQQRGGQQTAHTEAGYLPAVGGQAQAQRQQEARLLPRPAIGRAVRQGGQQRGGGPQNGQRGGA